MPPTEGRATISGMETDGTLLLSWLRLLGWVVSVREDYGAPWVGVAQRDDPVRGPLRVEAEAASRGELAWLLFDGALNRLDRVTTLRAA